jgi:hypothetical protein
MIIKQWIFRLFTLYASLLWFKAWRSILGLSYSFQILQAWVKFSQYKGIVFKIKIGIVNINEKLQSLKKFSSHVMMILNLLYSQIWGKVVRFWNSYCYQILSCSYPKIMHKLLCLCYKKFIEKVCLCEQ